MHRMTTRHFPFFPAMLLFALLLFTACGDSGNSDGDGDAPDILNACDECRPGEMCLNPNDGASAFCARECDTVSDCPSAEMCCMHDVSYGDYGYCVPLEYCAGDPPLVACQDEYDCRIGYDCIDFVCRRVTDGDDDDIIDGDTDGDDDNSADGDVSGPKCNDDPHLVWTTPIDFGAVQLGAEQERILTFGNAGPSHDAYIFYEISESTSGEFYLAAEDELGEGETLKVEAGKDASIVLKYRPGDAGPDVGTLNIAFIQPTDDGGAIPCYYSVDLISREKGEIYPVSDPEPCRPPDTCDEVDFGSVRLFTKKTANVRLRNQRQDEDSNRVLKAFNFRLEAAEDPNFFIDDTELSNGQREVLLAPGQFEDIPIACNPKTEEAHENVLIFNTNDENPQENKEFRINLRCEGVQPRVCVNPFPLLFGEVPISESKPIDVEVCNCGGYELIVDDVVIVNDDTFSFALTTPGINFNTEDVVLYPEGEGPPDSRCLTVTTTFYAGRREQVQANLQILSDSVGSEIYNDPMSGTGVGAELLSQPAVLVDMGIIQFDPNNPGVSAPKNIQVWNGGKEGTEAKMCCLSMQPFNEDGTTTNYFSLSNFALNGAPVNRPEECGSTPDTANCLTLLGGDNPNYFTFDVVYEPVDFGRHGSILQLSADDRGWPLVKNLEVRGIATDCPEDWWDLNSTIEGCEYHCVFQSSDDEPDMQFIDSNCDGIDGNIEKAVFVSAINGNNNNDGTWDSPLATLEAARNRALFQHKDQIYASGGTYLGRYTLSNTSVSLYGGYSGYSPYINDPDAPRGWQRSLDTTTRIVGDSIGMEANFINRRTKIQHMAIESAGGDDSRNSSYGLYSRDADALILEHVTVIAGPGRDGALIDSPGEDGLPGDNGERGQDYRIDDDSFLVCPGRTERNGVGMGGGGCGRGGNGGFSCKASGGNTPCAGYAGQAGSQGDGGGIGISGADGTSGHSPNFNGFDGSDGQAGLAAGSIVGGYFQPGAGQSGTDGGPGGSGGGGGGGGSYFSDGIWFLDSCETWGATGGGGGGGRMRRYGRRGRRRRRRKLRHFPLQRFHRNHGLHHRGRRRRRRRPRPARRRRRKRRQRRPGRRGIRLRLQRRPGRRGRFRRRRRRRRRRSRGKFPSASIAPEPARPS